VARRTVALPFHNNLTEADVERVVAALEEAVAHVVTEGAARTTIPHTLSKNLAAAEAEPEAEEVEEEVAQVA
jgi:hypothetical protein